MADSRRMIGPGGLVEMEELPPLEPGPPLQRLVNFIYDGIAHLLTPITATEMYTESYGEPTEDFPELRVALSGDVGRTARATTEGGLMLTVAEPVQHYKRVVGRSEEHTSELQSLMRISYAVFCLKKKKLIQTTKHS